MTTDQLQAYLAAATEAKARADKATPGPWHWENYQDSDFTMRNLSGEHLVLRLDEDCRGYNDYTSYIDGEPKDFDFIAAARTDIPTLADAVVALVAEVEQARKAERDEIIAKGVAWLADFREQDDDDDIVTYPEGAEMLADFIEALGGHVYG